MKLENLIVRTQEDYINSSEYMSEAEIKVYLSHIHIDKHEYLHDPKFKTRNWNIIVYPSEDWCKANGIDYDGSAGYGSAPDDWIQQAINYFQCPFCVSPLHCFDQNPTGEIKKPHWHVTIMFDGPVSWGLVFKRTKWLNCAVPVDCISLRGSIRYMAHLDNPSKYQYDPNGIVPYCGFDMESALSSVSPAESRRFLKDMCKFVINNCVTCYSEFVEYCMEDHFDDWFPLLLHNGTIIKDLIKDNK